MLATRFRRTGQSLWLPTMTDLRARAKNGFRDHRLYSAERQRRFSRSGLAETARNMAIALGRSTLFGHRLQFEYRGFVIPCDLSEMTGGGSETWDATSNAHLEYYRRWTPIAPDASILEIGCGIGRDAIVLSELLSSAGSYVGLDVTKPSIEWCQAHITSRFPNIRFVHLDVQSDMYNPGGRYAAAGVRLPAESNAFDLVVLHSVFTHMFAPGVEHYLNEIHRCLRPRGLVMASFFVVDDPSVENAQRVGGALTFQYGHQGCDRINDMQHPEAAVGYGSETIKRMITNAGLQIEAIHPGFWSGLQQDVPNGQDVVILRKGPTP